MSKNHSHTKNLDAADEVFVSYDFSDGPTQAFITWLQSQSTFRVNLGFEPSAKNLGPERIWDERVHDGIDDAKCVVVIVDTANANVGWEAGYALATKPERVLLTKVGHTPPWYKESTFKGAYELVDASDEHEFLRRVNSCVALPPASSCGKASSPTLTSSHKRLVLLPEHGGDIYKSLFVDSKWTRVRGEATWEDLKRIADEFSPIAIDDACWIFVENTKEVAERDGSQNMSCAFLAGYLFGLKKLSQNCVYIPVGAKRILADQSRCRRFYDKLDLDYQIKNNTPEHIPAAESWRHFVRNNWWDTTALTTAEGHVDFECFRRCNVTGEQIELVLTPWADYAETDAALEEYYATTTVIGGANGNQTEIRWSYVAVESLLDELTQTSARFIVASDAGVGKTIALRWLWRRLAERPIESSPDDIVPLYIQANELLRGVTKIHDIAANITKAFEHSTAFSFDRMQRWGGLTAESVTHLLIDGLDQLAPESQAALSELKSYLGNPRLSVVVAARRYAIVEFNQQLGLNSSTWSLLRLKEFDDDQIALFLRATQGHHGVYKSLPINTQRILHVPRILALFAKLKISQARLARNASDVFAWATTNLIRRDLERTQHGIGRHLGASSKRIEFTNKLLARLAYLQLKRFKALNDADVNVLTPDFHALKIDGNVIDQVHMVMSVGEPRYTIDDAKADITTNVLSLGWAVEHERPITAGVSNELSMIEWTNKSFLEFFGALWLSRYADETESREFISWVFYHGDRRTELFYYLNLFVADMPGTDVYEGRPRFILEDEPTMYRNPLVWMRTVEAWYLPLAQRALNDRKLRSCEMIFRTWGWMHIYAQLSYVDWWNESYQNLYDERARSKEYRIVGATIRSESQRILNGFCGELQALLTSGGESARIANEFVNCGWIRVPEGEFYMGYREDLQGFPPKTNIFWEDTLAKVAGRTRDGELIERIDDLKLLAEQLNKRYWFTGLIGLRDWRDDVRWLFGVFKSLRAGCDNGHYDVAINDAKEAIEKYWRRKDESVKQGEEKQKVREFYMHEIPVLNAYYGLFEPGHDERVANFIAASRSMKEAANLTATEVQAARQPPEHPATYISWYSAWAFCQWGRWTDVSGKSYWLRLPHEPEWEYVARHCNGGSFKLAPRDQRYWWGNTAYLDEEGGGAEELSNEFAHATQGGPGSTSSPFRREDGTNVLGNGLGFRDILGNVWEWCANRYNDNTVNERSRYSRHDPSGQVDPFGREFDADDRIWEGRHRVMRGGVWYFLNVLARLSHRYRLPPNDCDYKIGFRVVREKGSPDMPSKRLG